MPIAYVVGSEPPAKKEEGILYHFIPISIDTYTKNPSA